MIDKAKCFTEAMRQLALEYNAKPEDFTANQVTVTTPAKPDGVRLYSHELPFFQMASTGSGVVITANEVLHPVFKGVYGRYRALQAPVLAVRASAFAVHRTRAEQIRLHIVVDLPHVFAR